MKTLFTLVAIVATTVLSQVNAFQVGSMLKAISRKGSSRIPLWLSMSEQPAQNNPEPKKRKNRSIDVQFVQETPGGYISVLEVTNFKAVTHHRIVVGKEQIEDYGKRAGKVVEVEQLLKYVVKYMLDKGMKLENTEGMIDAAVFPVNYFTVAQLSYFHDDVDDKLVELIKEAPDV